MVHYASLEVRSRRLQGLSALCCSRWTGAQNAQSAVLSALPHRRVLLFPCALLIGGHWLGNLVAIPPGAARGGARRTLISGFLPTPREWLFFKPFSGQYCEYQTLTHAVIVTPCTPKMPELNWDASPTICTLISSVREGYANPVQHTLSA